MDRIQVCTLSQVHVGNGTFLQQGNDFMVEGSGDESYINVLSYDKLGRLIGYDAPTISRWATAIECGNATSFVAEFIKGHTYWDYSKRRITNYADFNRTNGTLKECIHDGMGRPYIPGSSIKGAIRTAVMATLAKRQLDVALRHTNNKDERRKIISRMEKSLMGDRPETDIFRHLAIGDAYFEKGSEIAVLQINLNITEKDKLRDFRKQQVVEAIAPDELSSFRLSAHQEFYDKLGLENLSHLFSLINTHTSNLVKNEIDYWDGLADDSAGYVSSMENILSKIRSCSHNECVIRVGQASGWRFITGAWLENLDENIFLDEIVPLCRPKNKQFYKQYDFPKSRRIDDESSVFGFIKLTCIQ